MNTQQLQRIEALLKQWKDRAKQPVDLKDDTVMFNNGFNIARKNYLLNCATEMGELLQSFSNGQTMDDIMGKLLKFLDREDRKEQHQLKAARALNKSLTGP